MKLTKYLLSTLLLPALICTFVLSCGSVDSDEKLESINKLSFEIPEIPVPDEPLYMTLTVNCKSGGTITCEGKSCGGDDFGENHDGYCACLEPFNGKTCVSSNEK